MNTHTDPGWWLVWMLLGALTLVVAQTIFDHIGWLIEQRRTRTRDIPPSVPEERA